MMCGGGSLRLAVLSHAGPVRRYRPVAVPDRICFRCLQVALANGVVASEVRCLARNDGLRQRRSADKGRKDCCGHELLHSLSPWWVGEDRNSLAHTTRETRVARRPFGGSWVCHTADSVGSSRDSGR